MYRVGLNSDLGESFSAYTIGLDKKVITRTSPANVACGYHVDDLLIMVETTWLCRGAGIAIGAHPSLPDLMGFSRRDMACSLKEVKAYVGYQLDALYAFAEAAGLKLQHVKPHGAFYNMVAKNATLTRMIAEIVAGFDGKLILFGLVNSSLLTEAEAAGFRTTFEVSADRVYQTGGFPVPCFKEGAVTHDKQLAIARVVRMVKEDEVTAITGEEAPLRADSICVHDDNPSAVEFVREIRKTLTEGDVQVEALGDFTQ